MMQVQPSVVAGSYVMLTKEATTAIMHELDEQVATIRMRSMPLGAPFYPGEIGLVTSVSRRPTEPQSALVALFVNGRAYVEPIPISALEEIIVPAIHDPDYACMQDKDVVNGTFAVACSEFRTFEGVRHTPRCLAMNGDLSQHRAWLLVDGMDEEDLLPDVNARTRPPRDSRQGGVTAGGSISSVVLNGVTITPGANTQGVVTVSGVLPNFPTAVQTGGTSITWSKQ